MSLIAFQSTLVRLATDAAFRTRVRADADLLAQDNDLTQKERARLRQILVDPGLDVTATLISSYRLGKILSLLPLTRTLLGDRRIGHEAKRFWIVHPPRSFYAVDEVIAFCDYLSRRRREGLRVSYLADVLAFERAVLELRRPGGDGASQRVEIQYDAGALLPPLTAGLRPTHVRKRPCTLIATVESGGTVNWSAASPATTAHG